MTGSMGSCGTCYRHATTYNAHAEKYFAMARMCDECARLIYGLREDLDELDAAAHREIAQVIGPCQ